MLVSKADRASGRVHKMFTTVTTTQKSYLIVTENTHILVYTLR